MGGTGCAGRRGTKGVKWDNCNSIINKIYFKINKKNKSVPFSVIWYIHNWMQPLPLCSSKIFSSSLQNTVYPLYQSRFVTETDR